MKITFVLPFVNLTGGIKILFEHANGLAARGHAVIIIYPGVSRLEPDNSWRWRLIEAPLRQLKYWFFVDWWGNTDADWFALIKRIRLHRVPDLDGRYIPPADIVIGTAPETINWVATYPTEKGIQVHFAQDYEVWALPEKFVDSTFQHPKMHLITIGSWQKKLYEEKFGRTVEAIIPNGVDLSLFRPGKSAKKEGTVSEKVRVLMNYHHAAYKGILDGLAAIETVRQTGQAIQTVMFGVHPLKADLPAGIEYHQAIADADLPALYRSCDIFLWPTHREGFGLPPMEAMACSVPVVGTKSGALADYFVDGQTGYMVEVEPVDGLAERLAEKLVLLVADAPLRIKMGERGVKAMADWGWDKQTEKLERFLVGLRNT